MEPPKQKKLVRPKDLRSVGNSKIDILKRTAT